MDALLTPQRLSHLGVQQIPYLLNSLAKIGYRPGNTFLWTMIDLVNSNLVAFRGNELTFLLTGMLPKQRME